MLFGPVEDFGDFGLVKDESIGGADIANGVIVDGGCGSCHCLLTLLLGECTIVSMVCCTAVAPEGHGKLPNGINGGAHPVIRGERDTRFPVCVVEAHGV